jgi:hypothetical protein
LAAAQFLTGNNPNLIISNPTLTTCTTAPDPRNTLIVNDWSGTAFAQTFPQGELRMLACIREFCEGVQGTYLLQTVLALVAAQSNELIDGNGLAATGRVVELPPCHHQHVSMCHTPPSRHTHTTAPVNDVVRWMSLAGALVLSSGSATELCADIDVYNLSAFNLNLPGDPDLTPLAGQDTFDADVLEFDLTSLGNGELTFSYVFARYVWVSFHEPCCWVPAAKAA